MSGDICALSHIELYQLAPAIKSGRRADAHKLNFDYSYSENMKHLYCCPIIE
jgi:hypothetical protein